MVGSLSGKRALVETKIFVNPYLALERRDAVRGILNETLSFEFETIVVPEGHRLGGVDSSVYDGYRSGLDSACVDVVVTTMLRHDKPAVLASKRAPDKLFGNKWWMQGGAIHSYRLITDFVLERTKKGCGIYPYMQGFIGVFRTCADDVLGSTLNLCYVGFVQRHKLAQIYADKNNTSFRLLTLEDLEDLPDEEKHWYPMFAFHRALTTMP